MKRRMIFGLLVCGLAACGVGPWTLSRALGAEKAAAAPAAVAPANPNAQAVAQERATAQNIKKEAEANAAKAAKYTGNLKAAAEALAAAQKNEAEAREALAAALEIDNREAARQASDVTIPRLALLTHRAWRKLSALETAAELSKPIPKNMVDDTPAGAKPALDALAAAQQAAAAAYEKYAAAITPDAPAGVVEDAYDDAIGSRDDVQLVAVAWNAAKALAYRRAACAKFNSPDLDKTLQGIEKANKELLVTQRQLNECKTRLRKLERASASADAEATEMVKKLAAKADAKAATPAPAAK